MLKQLMFPVIALVALLTAVAASPLVLRADEEHCNNKICAAGPPQVCTAQTNGPKTHCIQNGSVCAWDNCDAT